MTHNNQQTEAIEKKRKLNKQEKDFFKKMIDNIQWRGLEDLAVNLRSWARKFNLEELEVLKLTLPLWAKSRGRKIQADAFNFLQEEERKAVG